MEKIKTIKIYIGSKGGFTEFVKKHLGESPYKDLTGLLYIHDAYSRTITVKQDNSDDKTDISHQIPTFNNLVINADEYSGVNELLLFNIERYIELFQIETLIVHNPPKLLESNLRRAYKEKIETETQKYKEFSSRDLTKLLSRLKDAVLGQETAIQKLVTSIYTLTRDKEATKPIVLLLYGPSGVGKTESAKIIADSLGENLFRKQLSMFQNSEFITYLFGGKHYEKSLARDLVERESNVILLDEFDKANLVAHSAFYQLFDEGVFEDKNYNVNLTRSIILCTSNFTSTETIRKELGEPIFSRFDGHIEYKPLDSASMKLIIEKIIDEELLKIKDNDYEKTEILSMFEPYLTKLSNARLAKNLVREYFSTELFKKITS